MGNIYPNEECEILTKIKEVLAGADISGEIINPPERKYPNEECEILDKLKYLFDNIQFDLLPAEYKQVKGFAFASNTYYILPNFYLNGNDTVRISFSVNKACNVFGCYTAASSTNNYSLYASTASGAKYLRYASGTYKSQFPTSVFGDRFDVVITPTGSSGMPTGQDDSWTASDFEGTADLCIGHTSPSGTSSKLDGNIWGEIIVDGRLKLIPCERISDGVLGYYDIYSEIFFEPVGSAPTSLGYA